MKAIILAAGKGTRLGGLTKEIPKPMLPINGKPLLEYIIFYLKNNGIKDIGINLFTMGEQIENYFKDGSKFDVNIKYSYEKKLAGTAGSLLAFEDWLDNEDFIVIYGDIITNQPLQPLIELHTKNTAFATLFLHRRKTSNSFIELNVNNQIIDFKERPEGDELKVLEKSNPNGFLVNSAIQILNKDILSYIKENSSFDLPKDIYSKEFNNKTILGLELKKKRIAIDSQERYNEAQEMATKWL